MMWGLRLLAALLVAFEPHAVTHAFEKGVLGLQGGVQRERFGECDLHRTVC